MIYSFDFIASCRVFPVCVPQFFVFFSDGLFCSDLAPWLLHDMGKHPVVHARGGPADQGQTCGASIADRRPIDFGVRDRNGERARLCGHSLLKVISSALCVGYRPVLSLSRSFHRALLYDVVCRRNILDYKARQFYPFCNPTNQT